MRGVVVALVLSACVDIPALPGSQPQDDGAPIDAARDCSDSDGDGYLPDGCESATGVALDCAEGDATRHPGALEVCGDDVDQDCNQSDLACAEELAPNAATFAADRVNLTNGVMNADWSENFALSNLTTVGEPGTNLLYIGPMRERLSAVQMFPVAASWDAAVTPTVEVISNGPASTRFSVAWASAELRGTSVFTVFPDGRIHRDENFEVLVESSGATLAAYVGFEPDLFTHVDWSVDQTGPFAVADFVGTVQFFFSDTSGSNPTGSSCAYNDTEDRAVGFGWRLPAAPSFLGPRATQSEAVGEPDTHQIALQFDWIRSNTVPVGLYSGEFVTLVSDQNQSSCDNFETQIRATRIPLALSVAGGAPELGGLGDDDNDGYNEGGGFWQVTSGAETETTLTFSTEAGVRQQAPNAAIRIAESSPHDPVVSLNGSLLVRGRDYHLQRDSSGTVFLFIARPIANSEITIQGPR